MSLVQKPVRLKNCKLLFFAMDAITIVRVYPTNLEVTGGFVSKLIGSSDSNIFKISNSYDRLFWTVRDEHITRGITDIDSFSSFIEIDLITVLLVNKFDDVTLWTTQLRWSLI